MKRIRTVLEYILLILQRERNFRNVQKNSCVTYNEGKYLTASSSKFGQGAGTRFSEKSHLITFL